MLRAELRTFFNRYIALASAFLRSPPSPSPPPPHLPGSRRCRLRCHRRPHRVAAVTLTPPPRSPFRPVCDVETRAHRVLPAKGRDA